MRFIELSMVTGPAANQDFDDDHEMGEDDGMANPQPTEATIPTMVAVDNIRNYYPRKPDRNGRPRAGTRISFTNGSGMAVTETYDAVKAMLAPN